MPEATPISVRSSLAGKHVLVTGGSGFLGKVFIALLLEHLPDIGRIYVFMRPRSLVSGRSRFENILNTSPVFAGLHDRYGSGITTFLANRLEVVEGSLEEDGLGFSPALSTRLRRDLDLVVHSAGLVDFNPDLGKAIASNVDSTLNVAHFVERCAHASLLHISTCYVAGRRSGLIEECLIPDRTPNGKFLDAAAELADARLAMESIRGEFEAGGKREAAILCRVEADLGSSATSQQVQNHLRRRVRESLRDALSDEGMSRAAALGFPNTYTYTKFLAESLLSKRRSSLAYSILRPTIVESAVTFPFPSWNESFNGSAPLAYVMGSWYRMVPARPQAPFDVIPVDEVCKAMALCSAALLERRHAEVYQIGTSQRHRCSVGRAAELIVLSHRKHYRERERSRSDRVFKSRWDAILVHPDHLLGVEGLSSGMSLARDALDLVPDKLRTKMSRFETRLDDFDSKLADIRKMVELYMPFMYENAYVFESKAIDRHPALEPEFEFCPEKVDWRHYWLDIHMPGLRRYAFPLIEGRRPERYRAPNRATLPPSAEEDGQTALQAAYVIAHESLFSES